MILIPLIINIYKYVSKSEIREKEKGKQEKLKNVSLPPSI